MAFLLHVHVPVITVCPGGVRFGWRRDSESSEVVQFTSDTEKNLWNIRHRSRGRLRIWVAALYRRPSYKSRLERSLSRFPGVRYVEASPLTSTVLVLFREGESIDPILAALSQLGEPFSEKRSTASGNDVSEWATRTAEQVLAEQGLSRTEGLNRSQVKVSLEAHGPNLVPEGRTPSDWRLLAEQLNTLPTGLLTVSAALSLVTGGVADAAIILGVIGVNTFLGFANERQAKRTIRSLSATGPSEAEVIRDGRAQTLKAEAIVPGDLLVLRPGAQVAADARLVDCDEITVDESMLTGESAPVRKTAAGLSGKAALTPYRKNMVYRGTTMVGGAGIAVAAATGGATEMGLIHTMANEAEAPQTPMQRQLDKLGRQLALGIGGVCGAMFVLGIYRRYGWLSMFKSSVSLAVAAIPEGLPTVATTTFAMASAKLRKRNLLTRRMEAVETLGAVQILCLDKTGTLTLNRMNVSSIVVAGWRLRPEKGGFRDAGGRKWDPGDVPELLRLLIVANLCNETKVEREQDYFCLSGSPTEEALVQLAIDCGIEVNRIREAYPHLKTIHRTEKRRFMATVHGPARGARLIAVKGRPAEVLQRCRQQERDGQPVPLLEEDKAAVIAENDRMAAQGLRVLGFAYRIVHQGQAEPEDLVWLGLVGMEDPPRQGAKEALEQFQRAGVHLLMLTGDQAPTARSVAKALGLNGSRRLALLEGDQIDSMDPKALAEACRKVQIISSVTPRQKLKIVQALQKSGNVVAMSGDGINDGPALRAADVGIAMGANGTDVAREVGDLVLRDDNLATLITAFKEGRATHDNIKKSVRYVLATNLSEVAVVAGSIAAGIGQPVGAMQLLWLNLVTDIFPAMALCAEAPEAGILTRPPRRADAPLLEKNDFAEIGSEAFRISLGALGCYVYALSRHGPGARASTATFAHLTCAQLLHANQYRTRPQAGSSGASAARNPFLDGAIGLGFALHGLSLFYPPVRALLGNARLSLADILLCEGSAWLSHFLRRPRKSAAAPALQSFSKTTSRRSRHGISESKPARHHSAGSRSRLRGPGSVPGPGPGRSPRVQNSDEGRHPRLRKSQGSLRSGR